jgi:acyl carrier protein
MAAGDAGEYLRRRGLRALAADRAITALAGAVDAGEACVTVADIDWPRFTEVFTMTRPSTLFDELPEVEPRESAEPEGLTEYAQRLATATSVERERALVDLVRTHAAAVLGHDGAAAVPPTGSFSECGFDSLTAVDVRNRLAEATGLPLPTALVFDYPTPVALAGYLGEEIAAGTDLPDPGESRIRDALASVPLSRFRDAGVFDVMLRLAGLDTGEPAPADPLDPDSIDLMDVDALIQTAIDNLDS